MYCTEKSTCIKDIDNGKFPTWIGLSSEAFHKYLPESLKMEKGDLKNNIKMYAPTRPRHTSNQKYNILYQNNNIMSLK